MARVEIKVKDVWIKRVDCVVLITRISYVTRAYSDVEVIY